MSDEPVLYPPKEWRPRKDQYQLWMDIVRGVPNILAVTHRQYGKDEIFMHGVGDDALNKAATYVYCLPKTVDVRKNMWDAINPHTGVNRIDEAFPEYVRVHKLDQKMMVHWPVIGQENKYSTVVFTGSDNHTGLRGQTGFSYNFSEWAFCDPHALAVVRPIVEGNGGRMRFFTTAYGQNHAYKMLLENARKPDWRCYLITNNVEHQLVRDAKAQGVIHLQSHRIPADRMRNILEENIQLYGPEIGKALTDQEYECSFDEIVAGSFYLDLLLVAERERRITRLAHRPEVPVHAFFDIGYTDPTAIWYVRAREDGWFDVIDYDEYTITSAPELVPELRKKAYNYGTLHLPHDGAHHEFTSGDTAESILSRAGFRVEVMPRTDDAQQIPSVRTVIPRCRFNDSPSVRRGLDCLKHFHNKPKMDGAKTSWSPKPYHDWSSHGAKAFATLGYYAPTLQMGRHAENIPQATDKQYRTPYSERSVGWMR